MGASGEEDGPLAQRIASFLKPFGRFAVGSPSWGSSGPDDGDNTGGSGEKVENGGAAGQVSWICSQVLSCLGTKLLLPIFILGLGLVLRYSVVPV